ncbi:MAG: hypothetical protein ACE5PT_09005 [Gemmatimonadales bacterium]
MTDFSAADAESIRAHAMLDAASVPCPRCRNTMQAVRSTADRYVPHYLLEDTFQGLPRGREWRLLSVELLCPDCFPEPIWISLLPD